MTQAGYFETRRFNPGSLAMAAAIEFALIGGAVAWQTEAFVPDKAAPPKIFNIEERRKEVVPPEEPDQVPQNRSVRHQEPVVETTPVTSEDPLTWVVREEPMSIPPLPPIALDPPKPAPARAKGDVRSLIFEEDYPDAARRRGETGTVRARLDIGVNGKVTGCTIVVSSGSDMLNSATCRLLQTRARFAPAKDANGELVSDSYLTPKIVWTIKRDG